MRIKMYVCIKILSPVVDTIRNMVGIVIIIIIIITVVMTLLCCYYTRGTKHENACHLYICVLFPKGGTHISNPVRNDSLLFLQKH